MNEESSLPANSPLKSPSSKQGWHVSSIAALIIMLAGFLLAWRFDALDFVGAAGLGLLVGLSELLSRYRDDQAKLLREPAAQLYMALNAALSAFGLIVLRYVLGDNPSAAIHTEFGATGEVFTAGLSSMAILRSSVLTARVGTQDVPIGPGFFLKVVMDAVDREIDRSRGAERFREIESLMAGVDFAAAAIAIPVLCLGATQNLSSEDQLSVSKQIDALAKQVEQTKIGNALAALGLGLLLSRFFGTKVLGEAMRVFKMQLMKPNINPGTPTGSSSPP